VKPAQTNASSQQLQKGGALSWVPPALQPGLDHLVTDTGGVGEHGAHDRPCLLAKGPQQESSDQRQRQQP
jgi:hypothetical protein